MAEIILYVSVFIIWLMLFYHIFLMWGGFLFSQTYRNTHHLWMNRKPSLPTVSILIPAHNEEIVIEDTIRAMCNLNYPKDLLEVIVINDNSSDATGLIAESLAREYPFVKVIHNKPPFSGKGKSGALNVGFSQSSGKIIAVYDADNTPEPDALYNLVVALQKDRKAGAVLGKFRVINSKKNLLTHFINIETITFQWLAQAGRWFWFRISTIPGTNFAIRREILEELGGWDESALSEDTELSIRVFNLGYYIRFIPTAVTWEQEPETWKVWWKQRTRWACGNMYVIGKYLFRWNQLKEKKIIIDLVYFLLTYFMFFSGILVSHSIFVVNLFVDTGIAIGPVSFVLLIVGFLLYVVEILLALTMEKGQLTLKNFFVVLLMYFSYSQAWLFLIVFASYKECKRVLLKQEVKWYKTQRFKSDVLERKAS